MEQREIARQRLLDAALPDVAFDGWTRQVMARAAETAGYDAATALRLFPGGPAELVDFFAAQADRRMIDGLTGVDLAARRVRDRIAMAIRLRLEQNAAHREAIRRAVAFEALPGHGPGALRSLYRTVDVIWRAAGDRATDWNFYSKRLLLAGVYVATLLYWLDDRSEGGVGTWSFLARRIDDVMRIEKAKSRLRGAWTGLGAKGMRMARGPLRSAAR